MSKSITGAVAIGGTVYRRGQEAELAAAAERAGVDLSAERFADAVSGFDTAPDYASMEVPDLEALADERGVTPAPGSGSGKDGNVVKGDLVKALAASDAS